MYAVIDIETTGGKFNEEGITEIAIYKFDGKEIIDQLVSLVNPEIPIQPFVVKLTGISNKMLKNAPKFHEVAKRIIEITEHSILVAHNANFDYRVLKKEFERLGYDFIKDTLCTVELSRKLIPHQESYSLGKLCRNIGVPTNDRHRASGDAQATVKLLKLLLTKDIDKEITKKHIKSKGISHSKHSKKIQKLLESAPRTTGLYYIHNQDSDIIYVGKNKNIRSGLNQILLRKTKNAQKLHKLIYDVSFEETGSIAIASIRYTQEIKKHTPAFNSKRRKHIPTTVFNIENALLVDHGRNVSEKSIILIENQQVKGYAYVDLSYQITHIDILKNIITPIDDLLIYRSEIKKHWEKGFFKQIIRFENETKTLES